MKTTWKSYVLSLTAMLIAMCPVATVIYGHTKENSTKSAKDSQLLFPAADERSIEEKLARFLREKHDLKSSLQLIDKKDGDYAVILPFSFTETPNITICIDTQVSATRKTGGIHGRLVLISFQYVLPDWAKKNDTACEYILRLNNRWLRQSWVPDRLFLDEDNDLRFETNLNIPSPDVPLHAEMIFDALFRMLSSWKAYYAELKCGLDNCSVTSGHAAGHMVHL